MAYFQFSKLNKKEITTVFYTPILDIRGFYIDYTVSQFFDLSKYRFFQNDYESRPEGTAYMHGIYYEFWDFFSDFYAKTGSNTLTSQWPTDLQKLAQPPSN